MRSQLKLIYVVKIDQMLILEVEVPVKCVQQKKKTMYTVPITERIHY